MNQQYLELIGVPGSGKTTIAEYMLECAKKKEFQLSGRTPLRKTALLRTKVVFEILMLIFRKPYLLQLLKLKPNKKYRETPEINRTLFKLIIGLVIDTATINCRLRTSSNNLINDEGLVGKIVSLQVMTNLKHDLFSKLICLLPAQKTILLYVNTDPIAALSREKNRDVELSFFNKMTDGLKEDFFMRTNANYKNLLSAPHYVNSNAGFAIKNNGEKQALQKEVALLFQYIEDQTTLGKNSAENL